MNKYENIIIINAEMEQNEIEKVQEKIENVIKENGVLLSVENWGKKRLAYPIKKHNEGVYVMFTFNAEEDFARNEFERILETTEEIIKHIVVRTED